jgi:hypothetical protein
MALVGISSAAQAHAADRGRGIYVREARTTRSLRERFDRKRVSIVERCRILRAHHEWTLFQAIQFALWLAR